MIGETQLRHGEDCGLNLAVIYSITGYGNLFRPDDLANLADPNKSDPVSREFAVDALNRVLTCPGSRAYFRQGPDGFCEFSAAGADYAEETLEGIRTSIRPES